MENYVIATLINSRRRNTRLQTYYLRDHQNPFQISDGRFKKIFRLPKYLVHYLIESIDDPRLNTGSIPRHLKVLTALQFFAQGSYQTAVGQDHLLLLSQPSVSRIINLIADLIIEKITPQFIKFPTSPAEKASAKMVFQELFNMPNTLGAVDGTHIAIAKPKISHPTAPGSLFYNRKGFYSINCQIVCSAVGKIISINPNFPGSTHDSAIWRASRVYQKLETDFLNQERNQWLIDKRHRSSSSIVPIALDDTRSERKLNRASIPETDDQFLIAEGRCDDLKQKIDIIKSLRRKKKIKKRSTLTPIIIEQPSTSVTNPFIFVKTHPKKKMSQQAASRLRRTEAPNPARNYPDPATAEQHRIVRQVNGPRQRTPNTQQHIFHEQCNAPKKVRRARADSDNGNFREGLAKLRRFQVEEEYDLVPDYSTDEQETFLEAKPECSKTQPRLPTVARRKPNTKDTQHKDAQRRLQAQQPQLPQISQQYKGKEKIIRLAQEISGFPVMELFSKNRNLEAQARLYGTNKQSEERVPKSFDITSSGPLGDMPTAEIPKEKIQRPRPVKSRNRSHGYELPTVASQMKQAGVRYYFETANYSKIPFVVSKSTAPSHNIGVNIQQVLNGIKIQQPLSGIPLTIAHHMGLGHIPKKKNHEKSVIQPMLSNREINIIKAGSRLLRLPSFKYVSYKTLLSFYREGDGMVPKFLKAINRPHYFYTSMYNLQMNREDGDGATSKGRGGSQEAKQTLQEYASLYKEYEHLENTLKDNYDPEMERRKEDLARELASREEHIRRVVCEFGSAGDVAEQNMPLRASASVAEDGYRYSTYKLHGDNTKRPKEQFAPKD